MTAPELLAVELRLDAVAGQLAGDGAAPSTEQVRRALSAACAEPSVRPRALELLRRDLRRWLTRLPEVSALATRPPSRAAYRERATCYDRVARWALGAPWMTLARWHAGAPARVEARHEVSPGASGPSGPSGASGPPTAPPPMPSADPRWSAPARGDHPLASALDAMLPPSLAARIDLLLAAGRPHTRIAAGRAVVTLRRGPASPRAAFELAHELGHVVAGLVIAAPLPRAVDEAAASWMARHLEHSRGLPGLAGAAPELQREQRQRRAALASRLTLVEDHPALIDELLAPPRAGDSGVPWALWHDAGAQPAYAHAEALAERLWRAGLRWHPPLDRAAEALAEALAELVREAEALPAPVLCW